MIRVCSAFQDSRGLIRVAVEEVAAAIIELKKVAIIGLAITAQVDAASIALVNGHIDLNGEICEERVFRETGDEVANGWFIYFIAAVLERARRIVREGEFIPRAIFPLFRSQGRLTGRFRARWRVIGVPGAGAPGVRERAASG